jgi:hypothetical protein
MAASSPGRGGSRTHERRGACATTTGMRHLWQHVTNTSSRLGCCAGWRTKEFASLGGRCANENERNSGSVCRGYLPPPSVVAVVLSLWPCVCCALAAAAAAAAGCEAKNRWALGGTRFQSGTGHKQRESEAGRQRRKARGEGECVCCSLSLRSHSLVFSAVSVGHGARSSLCSALLCSALLCSALLCSAPSPNARSSDRCSPMHRLLLCFQLEADFHSPLSTFAASRVMS